MTTFTYMVQPGEWVSILPVVVLVVMSLILMLVDLVLPHAGPRGKHTGPENYVVLPVLGLVGVIGAMVASIVLFQVDHQAYVFNNMMASDNTSLYANLIILTAAGLGILFSPAYLKRLNLVHQGEFYALLLFASAGMMLMASAMNFIMIFVGLEMFSLALYILCAFVARRRASQESGMKYFLLSSFASAFLLYGTALAYAATGNTSLVGVKNYLLSNHLTHAPTLLLVGLGLMTVGFAFKVSAVPFQTWTPDVYQGAPAPVTAFMSVATKVAALVAFARVFDVALSPVQQDWMPVVWAISIITMIGGNILAVVQSNAKRLLAYSSIAYGGYLLIGIVVGGVAGIGALLFYLACYAFLNLGAFGVISILERLDNSGLNAADMRGLWYRRPWLAGFLAFFLLALAGFPPMAGFAGKYAMFSAALVGGHPELLIIGVLASILGMYYYLRVIATMFMEQQSVDVSELPALPAVPATPVSTAPRRGRTGGLAGGAATAVAERPVSGKLATHVETSATTPAEPIVVQEINPGRLTAFSWTGIAIAAIGTLAMGTILPFWLVDVAQQAAQMMLK